jgi:hypothetical protein
VVGYNAIAIMMKKIKSKDLINLIIVFLFQHEEKKQLFDIAKGSIQVKAP